MSRGVPITDDQIIEIIGRVAEGMTFGASCLASNLNRQNASRRIAEDVVLSDMYARAKEDYAVARVEEMTEVARTEPDVQRARLICDNIKWEAARVAPKHYGDKTTLNHQGNVTLQIVTGLDGPSEA